MLAQSPVRYFERLIARKIIQKICHPRSSSKKIISIQRCLVDDDVIKLFHNCAKFYAMCFEYCTWMVIVLERVSDILDHL
jgi:hypothetical protein